MTFGCDNTRNGSGSCRAIAGIKSFSDFTSKLDTFGIDCSGLVLPIFIAAAVNPENLTQLNNRKFFALIEFLDYRELFRESDINRAVAFFNISFSNSMS